MTSSNKELIGQFVQEHSEFEIYQNFLSTEQLPDRILIRMSNAQGACPIKVATVKEGIINFEATLDEVLGKLARQKK